MSLYESYLDEDLDEDYDEDFDEDYDEDYDEDLDETFGEARGDRLRRRNARRRARAQRRAGRNSRRRGRSSTTAGNRSSGKPTAAAVRKLEQKSQIEMKNELLELFSYFIFQPKITRKTLTDVTGGKVQSDITVISDVQFNSLAPIIIKAIGQMSKSGSVPQYMPMVALGALALFPDLLTGFNNKDRTAVAKEEGKGLLGNVNDQTAVALVGSGVLLGNILNKK